MSISAKIVAGSIGPKGVPLNQAAYDAITSLLTSKGAA